MTTLDPAELDDVLTLQLGLAWAGETSDEDAPRLGWWKSDMCSEFGGRSVLATLAPRTAGWAAYELALEAARRIDDARRGQDKNADTLHSLFHFGHPVDEALADRLLEHKTRELPPEEALPKLAALPDPWNVEAFGTWLSAADMPTTTRKETAGVRITAGAPAALVERARALAAANLGSLDTYPCAHYVHDATR